MHRSLRVVMIASLMLIPTSCTRESTQGAVDQQDGAALLIAPKSVSEAGTGFLGTTLALVKGCVGLKFGDHKIAVAIWPHGTKWISTNPLAIEVPGLGRVREGDTIAGGGARYHGSHPLSGVSVPVTCRNTALVTFTPNP